MSKEKPSATVLETNTEADRHILYVTWFCQQNRTPKFHLNF